VFICAYIHDTHFLYTCICYARHLALVYVLAGVANNPEFSCLDLRVWTVAAILCLIRVAQRERGLAVVCRTLFLPASSWSAREIFILPLVSTFLYFISYILLLCFLVIIYSWDIISCLVITVYWCYYCWIVCYNCASVFWFLPVLILSVYTWGYFWPEYIRRNNVSVPAGSGRYNNNLDLNSLDLNKLIQWIWACLIRPLKLEVL